MKLERLLAVGCVIAMVSTGAEAATSITEAVNEIQHDSELLSGWISNELKHAVPFNSTAGNVVPSQFKIFGVGFGVSAVVSATKMDNDALRNLGTEVVNTNEIDTFTRLPFPMILGHAKVGLPFGLDAGVRLGGIPSTTKDQDDTHLEISNTVFGLDLRKKVIEEGITRPFGLTVGLNYTHAKGHITATTPYSPNAGSNVTFSADSKGTARTDWKTDSVGVQAILNKKILILNPYIGASLNKDFGTVDTSIRNTGTATYVPGATSQSFDTTGSASAKAKDVTFRGLVGLEIGFLPFTKFTLQGEFANQGKLAGSLGLRMQFR